MHGAYKISVLHISRAVKSQDGMKFRERWGLAPVAHGISITRRDTQETCGDFCLLLPALCLDTAHSQKTKILTFSWLLRRSLRNSVSDGG
jgi:hypothetical protein